VSEYLESYDEQAYKCLFNSSLVANAMSQRELKKERLLETGLQVMALRGYNGTSIKDIVEAANVPKGSFYTYFKSKEDFALAALEKVTEKRIRCSQSLLRDKAMPPLVRLARFFQENLTECDTELKGGCFIGNMCQEMSESNEVIRLKVRQILRNSTKAIEEVIEEARLNGSMKSPLAAPVLAEFLFNAWEGTLMRMKASKSREPVDAFLALLPEILGGPTSFN
jgi:TetR/AcrR family transcriptional repressor of nem operon